MMRRKYAVCLILFTLLAVSAGGCGRKENNISQQNQTERTTQTEKPAETEKPANSASSTMSKKRIKGVVVIDETGKKRKLRLGDLDETDAGIGVCSSDFITASQISDGHYYYLHVGGGGKYTIYQDKRVVVGHFFIKEGDVVGFAKAGEDFLANIMHVEEHPVTFDVENITYDIVRINLETESVEVLLKNCADFGNVGDERINVDDIMFYRGSMYYDSREDVQWEAGGEYEPGAFLISRNLDNIEQQNKMTCTEQMNEAKPYLTFADGKILYGKQKGKEVSLYMFDLETREQTDLIRYKRKKAYVRYSTSSYDSVLLSVDNDYIYCQDMAIPRKGGKMQPLLKNALRNLNGGEIIFSSNKKYIFYLDKKYKLHRIDKKTGQDIRIGDKKLMSVQCMEDRIYVKELRHGYWDEQPEKRQDVLYCMSLDGTVKWKHTLERDKEAELDWD